MARVAAVPGVAAVEGSVTSRAAVVLAPDGRPIGGEGPTAQGRSWLADPAMNPLSIAEGRAAASHVDRFLTGETALPAPVRPTDRPLTPDDLAATFYQSLGIDPKTEFQANVGRPITLVRDGQPIAELLT